MNYVQKIFQCWKNFLKLQNKKIILQRIPQLMFGLFLCGFGLAFTIEANLGLNSWDVFHDGFSKLINVNVSIICLSSSHRKDFPNAPAVPLKSKSTTQVLDRTRWPNDAQQVLPLSYNGNYVASLFP